MINFIVCDDNIEILENLKLIITKLMIKTDHDYQTHIFDKYNDNFVKLINKKIGKKIYILDIEVGKKSGLDIARKIREKDWESIIIILTVHHELLYDAFKNRLLLLDFISKFDNYEDKLIESLNLSLNILNDTKQLTFKSKRISYRVDLNDILYITKTINKHQTIIKTISNEYYTSISLNKIISQLTTDFIQTHRACIINKNNIKKINFKENIITFINNEKISLLSKKYKKEVKKYVFS